MVNEMQINILGEKGPRVSAICFGAWPIGGGYSNVLEDEAIETVHAAIDEGVDFIDTAEMYKSSESILGKALKGKRGDVFLASKVSGDHSVQHIRWAIENSLDQLNTDYLDLYQIHTPKPEWPISDTMDELRKLQSEGKIRYIGVSNFNAEQTAEACSYADIQSSQPHYSLLFREAETDPLPFCSENGIGIMAYSPIGRGLLSGKYSPEHVFPNDDQRSTHSGLTPSVRQTAYKICRILEPFAQDHGYTLAQLAIAWVLANPTVTSAICGAKTSQQAIENARAGGWNLTASQMEEIESLLGELNN